jgi:hypothetical protein
VLACVNALFIEAGSDAPALERAVQHAFNVGQTMAVGLAAGEVAASWRRWGPNGAKWCYAAHSIAWFSLGGWIVQDDLAGLVETLGITASPAVNHLAGSFAALVVPVALAVGCALARPWLRWTGVAAGVVVAAANNLVLEGNYTGVHILMATAAAVLIGGSLTGLHWRACGWTTSRLGYAVRMAFALACAYTLVIEPPAPVLVEMTTTDGAPVLPLLTRLRVTDDEMEIVEGADPEAVALAPSSTGSAMGSSAGTAAPNLPPPDDSSAQWFRPRRDVPDVPPSHPSLLPENPIVLLITMDSVRAELLTLPEYAEELTRLRRLADESVDFRQVRSPGSGTIVTFAQVFTGKHHFQLKWRNKPRGGLLTKTRGLIHMDPSVRFSEIMQQAGIRTVTFASFVPLLAQLEILRGFDESTLVTQRGQQFALAGPMVAHVINRLSRPLPRPIFIFAHLMDPHAPYTSAGKFDDEFDGYVKEARVCSEAIGRLIDFLVARDLWKRTVLIVSADHGEGFSKHRGHPHHNSGLYDEIIRVPLLIRIPGVEPRVVDTPVSLIDLGPTLLDLLELATPGSYMGESLVPFLRGETPTLTRPLVSSTLFNANALYEPPLKLIANFRRKTVEIYDLQEDPDERRNLAHGRKHPLLKRLNRLRALR